MNQKMEFRQTSHLDPVLSHPATKALGAGELAGRWLNTKADTDGLSEIIIEGDGDVFTVKAISAGDGSLEWPEAKAKVVSNLEEEGDQRTVAIVATFDLGFMQTEAQIRANKGVLVAVLFSTFLDESGRSDYVTREFYYRCN